MAVSVARLPGEPIVIATVCGPLNVEAMRSMYALTADAAKDIDGPIVRIEDFLLADVSFREMARVMTDSVGRRAYSMSDPRIKSILVCEHNRMRFIPELFRQKAFGRIEMPVFDTVDEALAFARAEMALPVPV